MNVIRVETLESASRFLREHPGAKMIAGGTDLIPRLNQKIESKEDVCFLDNIPEMREIRKQEENHVVIGALTKLVELCESPDLSSYTALIEAAGKVASPQIRNQATIGGNILQENRCMYFNQAVFWSDVNRCFKRGGDRCYQYKNSKECMALFQSDIAPVLIAYGATAFIYNNGSQREMPVIDLYLPAGKKNLGNEDFLLGFKLPAFKENDLSAYSRKALRGSFDFPIVGCAVYVKEDRKMVSDISVVLGSAGVMPVEIKEIPPLLVGHSVSELSKSASDVLDVVAKHTAPFRDTRINTPVRKDMAKRVFVEAMEEIAALA